MWNLSQTGFRFSGNLPLRVGEVCSLTVDLLDHPTIYVAAAIVRWVRGDEYGVFFTKRSGVLYGQNMADPALMGIDLNIVMWHIGLVPHNGVSRHEQSIEPSRVG